MWTDMTNPEPLSFNQEEVSNQATESDCVDWCISKKGACVTMKWEGNLGRCYITSKSGNDAFTYIANTSNYAHSKHLTMIKRQCKDHDWWRTPEDLCKPNEPGC